MAEFEHTRAGRVRELCRQLKPLIGTRADRIWLAYVAENDDGKAQIQGYLELMAAQRFQGQLELNGPGLLPPPRDLAEGEYLLGTVAYNGHPLGPFGLREGEWIQHVGIFGRSGAGKTNLGYLVVQQLVGKGKNPLIFDWKRSYRDLLAQPGFEDVAVYTIGRGVAPLFFNPLIPPPGTSPQIWLKKLIAVMGHAFLLGDGVAYLLQGAIDQVYDSAGVYAGSVERWPTLADVLEILRQRKVAGREAGWMASALRALASLCFGEVGTLLNEGHDSIESLLSRPVILELDALTQGDKIFLTEAILLWIHHYRMSESTRETFKHAIVIEEAHHLLTNERQSLVGGQSVMEITFREIREFGESVIILDQHPSQISMPALGNTYCTICFNLKHRTDVSAMGQAMLLAEDEKAILGELQLGEAVVRLQGRGLKPFQILVPEFSIQKGEFTDARLTKHMERLGLTTVAPPSQEKPTRGPAVTHVGHKSPPTPGPAVLAEPEVALMADIVAYPHCGVAERYGRLRLSVRQGQKLKRTLVEKGLIQEELTVAPAGRLRVIRLTEQGGQAWLRLLR